MKNPKVLIIPDVHGRKFWREAIDKFPRDKYPDLKIIFLGDYLDPYTSLDNISPEDAFYNFHMILDEAMYDSRIQLLIGNHDWHYFVNLDTCRMDIARERQIEKLFKDTMVLFKLVDVLEFDGCKYVFSHAGITQNWLNDLNALALNEIINWKESPEFPIKEDDERWIWLNKVKDLYKTHDFEILNECLKNYDTTFYSCIPSMISRERGGWNPHGSMIWADVHEHLYSEDIKGIYQIFGHTITFPGGDVNCYAISPFGHCWSMLDSSKAFVMDIEGNIEEA